MLGFDLNRFNNISTPALESLLLIKMDRQQEIIYLLAVTDIDIDLGEDLIGHLNKCLDAAPTEGGKEYLRGRIKIAKENVEKLKKEQDGLWGELQGLKEE